MNPIKCILDGSRMTSRAEAHAHLAEALDFPDWYGKNLDALFDLLSTRSEETVLLVRHCTALEASLGAYGRALLSTLSDAAAENHRLHLVEEL